MALGWRRALALALALLVARPPAGLTRASVAAGARPRGLGVPPLLALLLGAGFTGFGLADEVVAPFPSGGGGGWNSPLRPPPRRGCRAPA